MQTAVEQRSALEAALRLGLLRREICLHYQPIVNAERRLIGVEALARWNHPERGLVMPVEFIPLAESSGLILQLGAQMLRQACVQLKDWAQIEATQHLTLAVNVSARQFREHDFVSLVSDALKSTQANPARLKLELTESLLLNDVQDVVAKMHELKRLGVGFSLDDFGTGYSSLSYLKSLPLDQLKIDKSFVRDVLIDPSDAAIAISILTLAHALNLSVVAEGVETEGQLQFLLRNGCREFQGYLFGKPQPVETLLPFNSPA
jgi:EAL domain-containing protein (putative c-di-GMP-specific phosphodiesterase class I)